MVSRSAEFRPTAIPGTELDDHSRLATLEMRGECSLPRIFDRPAITYDAVTLRPRTEITVPKSIRKAGYRAGDQVEFRVSGRTITIVPKLSTADDEYTPGQRRIIGARLAKAEEDIKAGRVSRPFHGERSCGFCGTPRQGAGSQENYALSPMKIVLSDRASIAIADAPRPVRKAFHKQLAFLERDLHHPSLQRQEVRQASVIAWQEAGLKSRSFDWRAGFRRIQGLDLLPKNGGQRCVILDVRR